MSHVAPAFPQDDPLYGSGGSDGGRLFTLGSLEPRGERNLLRVGWLIPYCFGASPAVCKSFFADGKSRLDHFDDSTYYEPYATSLRMCDIGYQNSREAELGFKADYDSVDAYVSSLDRAISTPCPRHAEISVKVAGEYRQLNANMLQIENEYYSPVRPKRVAPFSRRVHRRPW